MKKKIMIEGMSCGHCVSHVKGALEEIDGRNIEVDLEKKFAMAEFEDISDAAIKSAIEDVGYDVVSIEDI